MGGRRGESRREGGGRRGGVRWRGRRRSSWTSTRWYGWIQPVGLGWEVSWRGGVGVTRRGGRLTCSPSTTTFAPSPSSLIPLAILSPASPTRKTRSVPVGRVPTMSTLASGARGLGLGSAGASSSTSQSETSESDSRAYEGARFPMGESMSILAGVWREPSSCRGRASFPFS